MNGRMFPIKHIDTPPAALAMPGQAATRVAVWGAGDVGAAVAHALHQDGWRVLLIESAQPSAPRRGMCWVDAVFDGASAVAGLWAVRVFHPDEAEMALRRDDWLPLAVEPDVATWLRILEIGILVDARLRKHAASQPVLRPLAARTVGIGPGFVAGTHTDVVIESAWGETLGQVITQGASLALAGEPRPIHGVGRERLVYAPVAGRFESSRRIGEAIQPGDVVGQLVTEDGRRTTLHAPLAGVLRGLSRPGIAVQRNTKLVEVDPRGDPALCFGLGERPRRIAQGVLQAVHRLQREAARLPSGPLRETHSRQHA